MVNNIKFHFSEAANAMNRMTIQEVCVEFEVG